MRGVVDATVIANTTNTMGTVAKCGNSGSIVMRFTRPRSLVLSKVDVAFTNTTILARLGGARTLIGVRSNHVLVPNITFSNTRATASGVAFDIRRTNFGGVRRPGSRSMIGATFTTVACTRCFPGTVVLGPVAIGNVRSRGSAAKHGLNVIGVISKIGCVTNHPVVRCNNVLPNGCLLNSFGRTTGLISCAALALR